MGPATYSQVVLRTVPNLAGGLFSFALKHSSQINLVGTELERGVNPASHQISERVQHVIQFPLIKNILVPLAKRQFSAQRSTRRKAPALIYKYCIGYRNKDNSSGGTHSVLTVNIFVLCI